MKQWVIKQRLSHNQPALSVRQLLQKQWLLPSRLVHFLRVRRNVLVNGRYQSMNALVHPGDLVTLNFEGDEFRTSASNYLPSKSHDLNILYENQYLLVVNKAGGQKMHPNEAGETGTLMNDVAAYLQGSGNAAYIVHRLDKQTSGAVIVAKNPVVVPILDKRIAAGEIHRSYLAVVAGKLSGDGRINLPIGDDPSDPWRRKVQGVNARPAVTDYFCVQSTDRASLVKLKLQTGRTHQLRVHLSSIGHPIIGDPIYNPVPADHMLLHGFKQSLVLPFTNQRIEIKAPLPPYFSQDLIEYGLVR